MAYSYDSASGNQTTTLITVQGPSERNETFLCALRDSVFLTSKTIQIDLVASDPTTYTYITPTGYAQSGYWF